jgi:diguanylate cyclase (GGDEF)-like protein
LLTYLVKGHLYLFRLSHLKNQDLKEEINTLTEQLKAQKNINSSLEQKIIYYNNLRDITNKIQNLSLQEVCQHLVDCAYSLLGRNRGSCLLFLVDPARQCLNLFLSKKEDLGLVIKQKQGDVFDRWVVRHTSSLLVEDVKVDFRFDLEKTVYKLQRLVSSLIIAPLKVSTRFLGILRLENNATYFYSQDDLRFLDVICSVGALGLENALLFEHTQELAIRDSLTSVYTKGYYLKRLNEEIERSMRHPHKSLGLLMLDIDNFKDYNDRYGHIAGDIVLRGLGSLFLEFFSKVSGATVCRFGGEEFSVFLPEITKEEGKKLSRDLRMRVQEKRYILRRQKTQVTISIGLAYVSPHTFTAQDLILKADAALYRAKEKGRNQVCIT